MRRLRATLSAALAPPDEALIEASAGGERLVAKIRLVFYCVLWLVPIGVAFATDDVPSEVWIALAVCSLAIGFSAGILWLVGRRVRIYALAYLTSGFDITIVSALLIAFALIGRPHVAVNSMVVWDVYLLSILGSSLRLDLRVSLASGVLATAQYLMILLWVTSRWDVMSPSSAAPVYGQFSWVVQIGRLILMLVTTGLAVGIGVQARRLVRAAGTDHLTGLGNRAYFDERVAIELSRSARSGKPFTIVFVDVDHFKDFNDRWGHDAGDNALRVLARILQDGSRREDVVARWGGEEMVLVLSETVTKDAQDHFSRIRKRLKATPIKVRGAEARLSISGGTAEYPGDGETLETLLGAADRRMLVAKREGRDRVVSSG